MNNKEYANAEIQAYSFNDWLHMHNIDADSVKATLRSLVAFAEPSSCKTTAKAKQRLQLTAEEVWTLTSRALLSFVPELSEEITNTSHNCERTFRASQTERPYTLYRGVGTNPFVSLCYRGSSEDVICVAHEFGHALQYHTARGRFTPPILRELAAFFAEYALIDYVRHQQPELHLPLRTAWENDNEIYIAKNARQLYAALSSIDSQCHYSMNYPVARFVAMQMFNQDFDVDAVDIFRGSLSLSAVLSLVQLQKGGTKMENYLLDEQTQIN